jgi:Fic family protein
LSTIDSKSSAYVDLDQESQDLKVSIERYLESIEQKNTETKNAESAQEALDKQNEFFYGECLMTKTEDNDSIFFQQSESESEILVLGSPSVIEESDYTVRS